MSSCVPHKILQDKRTQEQRQQEEQNFEISASKLRTLMIRRCEATNCPYGKHDAEVEESGGHRAEFIAFKVELGEFLPDISWGAEPKNEHDLENMAYARLDEPVIPYLFCLFQTLQMGVETYGEHFGFEGNGASKHISNDSIYKDPNYNKDAHCNMNCGFSYGSILQPLRSANNIKVAKLFDKTKRYWELYPNLDFKTRVAVKRDTKNPLLGRFQYDEEYEDFGRVLKTTEYYHKRSWPEENFELPEK